MKQIIALIFLISVVFAVDVPVTGCVDTHVVADTNFVFAATNTFAEVSTCLQAQTTKTTLTTLSMSGLPLAVATLGDFSAINWTGFVNLDSVTIDFSGLSLNKAAIDLILDGIAAIDTAASGAAGITTLEITLNAVGDVTNINTGTLTADATKLAAAAALGNIYLNPFGILCTLDSTNDAYTYCQTAVTITDFSQCTAALNTGLTGVTLAPTTPITDGAELNTCISELTGVTDLTININGSAIVANALDLSAVSTTMSDLTMNISGCGFDASVLSTIFGHIDALKTATTGTFVNLTLIVLAAANDTNTVDFATVKAGQVLSARFTQGSVQFWNPTVGTDAACIFVQTDTDVVTKCANYPETFQLSVNEDDADMGSVAKTYMKCAGSQIVVTQGTVFDNLYAASAPDISAATITWTLTIDGTVTNPADASGLTLVIADQTVASVITISATAGVTTPSVATYQSETITIGIEECLAVGTITVTGAEGDSNYELCEEVVLSVAVPAPMTVGNTILSVIWTLTDGTTNFITDKSLNGTQNSLTIPTNTFDAIPGSLTATATITMTTTETVNVAPKIFSLIACDATDHQTTTTTTDSSCLLQVSLAVLALIALLL